MWWKSTTWKMKTSSNTSPAAMPSYRKVWMAVAACLSIGGSTTFSFLRHFWQAWSHQTGKSKEWKDTTFLSSTTLPLSRCNMCWFFRPLRIQHCYGTVLSPLLRSLPYFHQALALRCRSFDAATSVLFLPDYDGTKGLGGRYA